MKPLLLALLLVTVPALAGQPDWMKPQPTQLQIDSRPRTAEELRRRAEFMRQIEAADRIMREEERREQLAEIVRLLQALQR